METPGIADGQGDSVGIGWDGYPHSSEGIHQAMTQSSETLSVHSLNKFNLFVDF